MVDFSLTTTDNGRKVDSCSTLDILDYSEHLDKYGIEGSKITSLKFKVKASRDANVYLSSSPSMDSAMPFYDVNFGAHANTKTLLIRRKDNLLTTPFKKSWDTVIDRHCLNSSEFRDFWVSWDRGIVKHGRGTVIDDDLIGKWIDPNPFPVKSIGVLNSYDSEGDWIIHATGNHACKMSTKHTKRNLYDKCICPHILYLI